MSAARARERRRRRLERAGAQEPAQRRGFMRLLQPRALIAVCNPSLTTVTYPGHLRPSLPPFVCVPPVYQSAPLKIAPSQICFEPSYRKSTLLLTAREVVLHESTKLAWADHRFEDKLTNVEFAQIKQQADHKIAEARRADKEDPNSRPEGPLTARTQKQIEERQYAMLPRARTRRSLLSWTKALRPLLPRLTELSSSLSRARVSVWQRAWELLHRIGGEGPKRDGAWLGRKPRPMRQQSGLCSGRVSAHAL